MTRNIAKPGRKTRKSDLWAFCLTLYARPGVAPACLALQDRHGADIPLLLAVLWHGLRGYGPAPLGKWRLLSKAWQRDAVVPLRDLRRAMKGREGWEEIREGIKRLELAAEKAQLDSLAATSKTGSPDSDPNRDMMAPLSTLLGSAFATRQTRKILAEMRKMSAASTRSRNT
ncbi:MAG: TIGR02444 family protein [Alphaproteobacteria bacterium]|nr:TIGR02444 family protein [Alphaproteobacteria bacterium]